jgi:hypothetical protein
VPYSVSPYARLDALAEFREWLEIPVSTENVDAFVNEIPDRATLFSGSIFGSIRWARDLGVPQTRREGAFLVEQFLLVFGYRTPQGEVWAPIKQDEAVLWDGPDDDSHHRVTYFLPDSHPPSSNYGSTSVTVKLRQVWWPRTPPNAGHPRLRPFGWEFAATGQGVRVLPEHELYVNRSDTFDPLPF